MAEESKKTALFVPYGKQGTSIEAIAHNLNLISTLVSAFLAAVVRKYPDLKGDIMTILQDGLALEGQISQQALESFREALAIIADLPTEDEFIH